MRTLPHLHATAELSDRVLLPGDPGRALRLAQSLLREPKMFNHNRGLWGYTGESLVDGELLSIQSTGMGGPSAAIVVSELIELGATRLLRIGTCGALSPKLPLGRLIIAGEAICDDGTSRSLGADARAVADPGLTGALRRAAAELDADVADGPVVSSDLYYDADGLILSWVAAGALAVEMEAATIFTLAHRRDVHAGCVLLVSNQIAGDASAQIKPDHLASSEQALGELASRALSLVESMPVEPTNLAI